MVVNLLSSKQQRAAVRFSRPDLYPEPFRSVPYSLTAEGLPVIDGAVGALSCSLLRCIDLRHPDEWAGNGGRRRTELGEGPDVDSEKDSSFQNQITSELFIARVMRVESVRPGPNGLQESESEEQLPLLYRHRHYTTVAPIESEIDLAEGREP